MSGHSKWSQIKHQKAKTDQKRGQAFTKLGNAIAIAVKEGGNCADPASNFRLRLLIEKAKAIDMPKVNIKKAIERGLGKGGEGNFEELLYEGYGPGKTAILVQVATDNRQRTYSQLKNLFTENGGHLSSPGSVVYLFQKTGEIKFARQNLSEDKLTEIALEAGCDDVLVIDDTAVCYAGVDHLHTVKDLLTAKNLKIIDVEIIYRPVNYIQIEDRGTAQKVSLLVDNIEQHDDVLKVFTNTRNQN